MMRIGIIGGSGYVGSELRAYFTTPQVEVTMVTSRQKCREYVFNMHPTWINPAKICSTRYN